jgi:hypothetical protein
MATTYKQFSSNDIASNRTLLHESIPITGSILSGTYIGLSAAEENIKTYSHGMFSSVYDYPYLSSSSNHLMDITMGYAATSNYSQSSPVGNQLTQQKKKINIYNQMAQVLVGYDSSGSIRKFDEDGDLADVAGNKINEAFFINFSRLLTKDEIKKGSFELEMGVETPVANGAEVMARRLKIVDHEATGSYKINSPAGEYGILFATSSVNSAGNPAESALTDNDNWTDTKVGLIYYQAGIIVLSSSIFNDLADYGVLANSAGSVLFGSSSGGSAVLGVHKTMPLATIQENTNFFRARMHSLSFNNTTELNSTIHFCRAHHNEFNYSSNPTYLELTGSKIAVKDSTLDNPVSYITTIGLYSSDNELLAVAKLSEPIKKDPQTELTFRVRLDY